MAEKVFTVDKARQALAAVFVRQGFVAPETVSREGACYFEFGKEVWVCGVTISLREDIDFDTLTRTYRVELTWSSISRTVAQATVALANYQKALALAAELQAVIEGFPTVVEKLER